MPFDSHSSQAVIRRLRPSEAALVNHLALASLWNVELPRCSLAEVSAFLQRVPSLARTLARGGSYRVAEIAGVVAAGGGWSLMPMERLAAVRQPVLSPLFFIDPEAADDLRARLLSDIESDILRAGHTHAHAVVPFGSASAFHRLGYRLVGALDLAHGRVRVARLRKTLASELAAVA